MGGGGIGMPPPIMLGGGGGGRMPAGGTGGGGMLPPGGGGNMPMAPGGPSSAADSRSQQGMGVMECLEKGVSACASRIEMQKSGSNFQEDVGTWHGILHMLLSGLAALVIGRLRWKVSAICSVGHCQKLSIVYGP